MSQPTSSAGRTRSREVGGDGVVGRGDFILRIGRPTGTVLACPCGFPRKNAIRVKTGVTAGCRAPCVLEYHLSPQTPHVGMKDETRAPWVWTITWTLRMDGSSIRFAPVLYFFRAAAEAKAAVPARAAARSRARDIFRLGGIVLPKLGTLFHFSATRTRPRLTPRAATRISGSDPCDRHGAGPRMGRTRPR